jgi:hypothetical protein
MAALQTYSTFRPTSYDAAGLGCPDRQTWLVAPVTICPNVAECADESNWQAQLNALSEVDPDGNDHEVCEFGHWATPFDIVLVRPGTPAAECAQELAERLENCPILNEDDLSERESDLAYQNVSDAVSSLSFECQGTEIDRETVASDLYHWYGNHGNWGFLESPEHRSVRETELETGLDALGWVRGDDDVYRRLA